MAEQIAAVGYDPDRAEATEPDVPAINDPSKRCEMVGWYDPGQLARTGVEVCISTIFGRHADNRLIQALVAGTAHSYDHTFAYKHNSEGVYVPDTSAPVDELWIDYVGDVGDGWDSTYAVARSLAQPSLAFTDRGGAAHATQRGSVLIFGGDQVYPTASRSAYEDRLVGPYTAALGITPVDKHPHAYAIPGTHDWYDSLSSFTRLFCSGRWFGGWRTQQCRSYFALKLPHGWWLIGTDVQLDSDIDAAQVDYFRQVAKEMAPGDKIILCNAEPHWIYAKTYGKIDSNYNEQNLAFLEEKVFMHEIRVYLAGDLHHYRRHEAADGTQKITAGGGGAFLHPTHGADVDELDGGFKLKGCFPDTASSWRLGLRNLIFPILNPKFGLVTAVLYLFSVWPFMTHLGGAGFGVEVRHGAVELVSNPMHAIWLCIMLFGFLFFTDTHSKAYRFIAGTLHGLSHVVVAFIVAWIASLIAAPIVPLHPALALLLCVPVILAGGWLAGPLIMGLYLFISLNLFGHHQNEAFSSLAIPDWKNFLRMHIDRNGDLTIYPVGLRRVPRTWKPARATSGPTLLPDDASATEPELIENPIVVKRMASSNGNGIAARGGH
jgi:hypothetical protein